MKLNTDRHRALCFFRYLGSSEWLRISYHKTHYCKQWRQNTSNVTWVSQIISLGIPAMMIHPLHTAATKLAMEGPEDLLSDNFNHHTYSLLSSILVTCVLRWESEKPNKYTWSGQCLPSQAFPSSLCNNLCLGSPFKANRSALDMLHWWPGQTEAFNWACFWMTIEHNPTGVCGGQCA